MNAQLKKWLEPGAWFTIITVLSVLILGAGMKSAELREALPIPPKALYKILAKSKRTLQIVDVREDAEEFEDTHVPGALPFPGCDLDKTPDEVRPHVLASVPTIVVSEEGDPEVFKKCQSFFKLARNLEGGIEGWTDEGLPEDSGEYVPPKPGAGGGCL